MLRFTKCLSLTFAVAMTSLSTFATTLEITNFEPEDNAVHAWTIVDDGVMGGLSKGKISIKKPGRLHFSGKLSLENNGGFSSMRTTRVALDLSEFSGLTLRVKGDGRTFQIRLTTDARFRSMDVSFKADIPTVKDEWTEVHVPFSAFTASFRGLQLPKEKFDPSKIQRLGILLGDKKPGSFALELDSIQATTEPQAKP